MIKIVHTADVHLDTPFSGFLNSSDAYLRREEILETFDSIIHFTKEYAADLLLIAGDLFDQLPATQNTLFRVTDILNKIPEIPVLVCTGNHDFALIQEMFPEHVHLFCTNEISKIAFPAINTVVYGAGFTSQYQKKSMLSGFHVENNETINIMMLHGEVCLNGAESDYHPIFKSDIENSGLDYIALGHKHKYSGVLRAGQCYYAYPGIPAGRGFDELGDTGFLYGMLEKHSCQLQFKPASKRRYLEERVNVSGLVSHDAIADQVINRLGNNITDIFKVYIEGELPEDFLFSTGILMEKLKQYEFIKLIDQTMPAVDYAALSKEKTLKGLYVKNMLQRIETAKETEKQVLMNALKIGIRAFDGQKAVVD